MTDRRYILVDEATDPDFYAAFADAAGVAPDEDVTAEADQVRWRVFDTVAGEYLTDGMATDLITCDCSHCHGRSARVRCGGHRRTPTTVHNLVCIAHNPVLSQARSTVSFGPWAVTA